MTHTGTVTQVCMVSVPLPLLHAYDRIEVEVFGERTLGGGRPDTDEVNINVVLHAEPCVPGAAMSAGTTFYQAVLNSASTVTVNVSLGSDRSPLLGTMSMVRLDDPAGMAKGEVIAM